jgi:hypothetical protein
MSSTTFEQSHFAEGRFRRAYKGTWISPPSKRGSKCVVKEWKESYIWEASGWDETVKIYDRARGLAHRFNSEVNPSSPINVTDAVVQRVTREPEHGTRSPSLNEWVIVEDYLEGNFTKWCNNYGYISNDARDINGTLTAFAHWSWVATGAQEMITDIQGVRDSNGYHLTDPAILSLNNRYGCTDMGIEGMAMFFINHECNDICRGWKRPRLSDFHGKIPQPILTSCQQMVYQVNNATSYMFELKFPPEVKRLVTQVFLQI